MSNKNNLFKLSGKVQHYQWGGQTFLPDLLKIANEDKQPFAEYWLGAHDNFPSELQVSGTTLLNKYIEENPSALGKQTQDQFKRLPYLLKVLDVKDMLSIQVHPAKQQAVEEFEKENKAGIPLNASNRNYKDDNHKPELMLALSDFWLLHGFKPGEQIRSTISAIPEFSFMLPLFDQGGYKQLYRTLMEMEELKVYDILYPLLERVVPLYDNGMLQKKDADFWAARAAITFNRPEKSDRGIFSIYLLNLVNLKEGEAIFQDAGILHAYLEGQNIEIMANSDNVLRGGLTPKHIDVNELMKHVSFRATIPEVIHGSRINDFEEVYLTPAPDFQLSQLSIKKGKVVTVKPPTTDILIVMEGRVQIMDKDMSVLSLDKGEAAVAFPGSVLQLLAKETAVVFRASVPLREE